MWYVYILQVSNGHFYTGITNDLKKRMSKHRRGKGSKYVAAHLPFIIVYTEEQPDKSCALKREMQIKKLSREQKKKLIKEEACHTQ